MEKPIRTRSRAVTIYASKTWARNLIFFVETSALQAPTPPSPGRSSESRYSMLGGYGDVDDADAKSQQTPRLNDLRKK